MARIFNIYFTYEDELYSAIVSVRYNPFFTEYVLGNLDADLRILLPGNSVVSEPAGNLFFQNSTTHHSPQLMNAIIKSLAAHLQITGASF
jgi:hypothetical protein